MLTGPGSTVALDAGSTIVTTGGGAAVSGSTIVTATPGGSPAENAERLRARIQSAVGDDYRVVELLGRGGMGIVFRATETSLDREVALKVLALDPLLAPDAYERFEREARLAARLDHPNIVPIFSVGRRESVAFYTMRLVRGGSVEEMLDARRRFEYDHAIAILRDVAAALDYAHGRGVVHRDIKPGNILVGETGHALVADFGIAKALGGSTAGATGTGIIGSPGYMSPEQWRGDVVDGRADQYALATVAFEMLAGRRPFESPNMQELLQKHLNAEVPAVSTYRFGLHEGVDEAIRRALAKKPEDRFATATAFIDALSGLRSATATNRSVRVPRYEPPAPRKRRWGRIAFLALLLGGGGAAFAAPQTRPQALQYAEAARARAETLVERVRYAVIPPPLDVQPITDSLAGDSTLLASVSPPLDDASALERSGDSGVGITERQPIAMDPQLYGDEPSPFRTVPGQQVGYVRVVVHGGVSPIIVDGRALDAAAGPAGHLVRLEVGRHYISVRGAGVLYVPSQVTVEVGANDTTTAEFGVPRSLVPAPTAVDSSTSAAAVLPAAAPGVVPASGGDSIRTDSVRRDSARPDSARPDSVRVPPPK